MSRQRRRPSPWNERERALLGRLHAPEDVQAFLDGLPYNDEITCRSPRRVMRDRRAHCFEGALFAVAALAEIGGTRPALVDLRAARGRDDDHVVAVFRRGAAFGAVAKSNFSGLRFRAPVYRTLRELVMSYFDDYFNAEGERTLRAYSRPYFPGEDEFPGWRTAEEDLDAIGERLDRLRHFDVVPRAAARSLPKVDGRRLAAGLLGVNKRGLFRP